MLGADFIIIDRTNSTFQTLANQHSYFNYPWNCNITSTVELKHQFTHFYWHSNLPTHLEGQLILSFCQVLQAFNTRITIEPNVVPLREQQPNKYIINEAFQSYHIEPADLKIINCCHLNQSITTLSEMFNTASTHLFFTNMTMYCCYGSIICYSNSASSSTLIAQTRLLEKNLLLLLHMWLLCCPVSYIWLVTSQANWSPFKLTSLQQTHPT